ncbi:hypothetical protein C8T65DRAFT_654645 [Cerioporus squamosus]|nr:hypothetical protein C8T65DRAFT_654645 [Cerioporus squamosus]
MADSSFASVLDSARAVETAYFASAALIAYEYCLTFHREVQQIWRRGFSSSTFLFYAVRYPAVISPLFVILDLSPWNGQSDRTCTILVRSEMALNVLLLSSAALFSALRAYALCGQNLTILVLVLVLGLVNPAISVYTFVQSTPFLITAPLQACGFLTVIPPTIYEKYVWMIGARASALLADAIVLIVTWKRTWSIRAEVASFARTSSLTQTLMRDGTAYFVVLLIVNLIGLALIRRLDLVEPMSTWIAIFTSILTSRFILDLHEASDRLCGDDTRFTHFASLSMPVFRQPTSGQRSVYGTILTETTMEEDWEESDLGSVEWKAVDGMGMEPVRAIEPDGMPE